MAKNPNKYVRLPVHLAYRTCPRGQVDCCIELSDEHPDGGLQKKCATCLSNNCGFTKKDKTAREARVELRKWLDEELARKRAAAIARDKRYGIFALDGPPVVAAVDRGGRTKRNRPNYVDSESEGDEDQEVPPKRTNGRAEVEAATTASDDESSQSAIGSDFVQQAIKLVNSSRTIAKQLAEMQKTIDTEMAARLQAEGGCKEMEDHQTRRDMEKDEEMAETMKAIQVERDQLRMETTELQRKLEIQAELAEEHSQSVDRGCKALQAELELSANLRRDGLVKDEQMADLETELVKEREEHVKTTTQLVKWKATFAALQGLQ